MNKRWVPTVRGGPQDKGLAPAETETPPDFPSQSYKPQKRKTGRKKPKGEIKNQTGNQPKTDIVEETRDPSNKECL